MYVILTLVKREKRTMSYKVQHIVYQYPVIIKKKKKG